MMKMIFFVNGLKREVLIKGFTRSNKKRFILLTVIVSVQMIQIFAFLFLT